MTLVEPVRKHLTSVWTCFLSMLLCMFWTAQNKLHGNPSLIGHVLLHACLKPVLRLRRFGHRARLCRRHSSQVARTWANTDAWIAGSFNFLPTFDDNVFIAIVQLDHSCTLSSLFGVLCPFGRSVVHESWVSRRHQPDLACTCLMDCTRQHLTDMCDISDNPESLLCKALKAARRVHM